MSYILSNDAALYYEESGSGEPLILLPGLLGTIESHWRRFLPELSKHFHTVVVDLRGHGRTNNPSGQFRLEVLIDDLHVLMDTLQIEQAHVCGYSLGGYIGLAYGLHFPKKITSLIMHGTKFYWTTASIQKTVEHFNAERISEKLPAWAETLQKEHAHANGEDGWKQLLSSSSAFIEAMPREGITETQLADVRFPVLISVCDADEMIPGTEANRLASAIPKARIQLAENCKHPFQTVQKQSFIKHCLSFLLEHTDTSAPITRRG